MRHSIKGFWCVNEYFFILYCAVESGATWLEIACPGAWPSWVLYDTVCLLSCHRRSQSLLALYHFHQHVYSNRCFIWLSNSLTMARNVLAFIKSKFSAWIVFSLGTTKKDALTPLLCYISSQSFDTDHVYHIIPDDKHVITQKHNTKLYWLLSLGCDTLDGPNCVALPFRLAHTRPEAVHWTFMLQPYWGIWVEKMGFFASRIAVTLFLTLWICRTQGQHGGMESMSKLHSPIFVYLHFSSSALVRSRTTLVSDSSLYTRHTHACTFQKYFVVKINEWNFLSSFSFCMRMVVFLSFLLVFARPTTMKGLLYSEAPASLPEMIFLRLKRSYGSVILGESIRLMWLR